MRVELDGGAVFELGETEATPTIGITDFSRRVTDDFGVTTVVERGFSRRMSVRLGVPFDDVDALQRRLADLRATSALWVADDRFASLSVRGFYKDFDLDLAVPPLSFCTLTVEGLAETAPAPDAGGDPAPDGQPSTLRLLQPVVMTASVLSASNVPENDAAEWSSVTNYPVGARVMKAATHRVYESLAAANLDNDPAGISGKWLDVGPTNRWAMFDQALGTATSAAGAIVVTLDPGTAGAVALLDVVAATVRLQATGCDRTLAAGAGAITFLDLPTSGQVTVTIAGAGNVSVGTLLIGRLVTLGITEASPTAGITDFSRKVVDDFGDVAIVQRAWAKRMAARALIRTDAIDAVANRIAAVRARPCLWIGQAGIDSLTVYGFFKDFSIEVGENVSKLSLSIEGLSKAAKVAPLTTTVDWTDLTDKTGAKPADNATVGAPPGTPVGTRPAEQVIDDIDLNTEAILEEALRQDDLAIVMDARTFVDGQPVSTRFESFKTDVTKETSALASTLALIGAKTADGTAWVLDLDTVQVDETKTLAARLEEVGISEADVSAKISEYDEVVSERFGKVEATRTIAIDINGNVVGTQLVGSEAGPGSLNLINADLRMGTGRVIFNNGTVMRVQGVNFGANGDLISWFGPTMPLASCTRANAISFEANNGDAYFGGSLSAGLTRNAVNTASTALDANTSTGVVGSRGGQRVVVVSYAWTLMQTVTVPTSAGSGSNLGATIVLSRNGVDVATLNATGTWQRSDAYSQTEPGSYSENMGGSLTFTDNTGGLSVEYKARLTSRVNGPGAGGSANISTSQTITLIQTEA